MKKTTMQDIANELNISRVTVWKVFNNQPGVSESLKQKILKKAKDLGYQKAGQFYSDSNPRNDSAYKSDTTTVSVVVSRPESSLFWTNIIHQIAKELNKFDINLMYTYLPSYKTDSYKLPSVLTDGTLQGIIVLNVYDLDMFHAINQLQIPKVFFDSVSEITSTELTGDLLLLEGESILYQITNSIIEKGRTKIGFMGDIYYAKTNLERYNGYCRAMEEKHLTIKSDYCLTGPIGIESYAEEIHSFLENLKEMPEAFVCVSDYVAHFVLKYLLEHDYEVPFDVAVSGFDGRSEYLDKPDYLTTVPVETRALGKRLARQLLYRMQYPDFPREVIYQIPRISYAASTNFND